MKRGPDAGFDLVLLTQASVSLLRALGDDATVAVIDASQDVAAADTLVRVEDEAIVVYSGPAGTKWERPVAGLGRRQVQASRLPAPDAAAARPPGGVGEGAAR